MKSKKYCLNCVDIFYRVIGQRYSNYASRLPVASRELAEGVASKHRKPNLI